MTELDVDLEELPLRVTEGFDAGCIDVRVFVAAVSEDQYEIEGLSLYGHRFQDWQKGYARKWCNVDQADPLYPVLLKAVKDNGAKRLSVAIHDHLYALRADRVRDRAEREIA
jgi:hypothetical protein